MNPNLIRLLALLGQGSVATGVASMLADNEKNIDKDKFHGSYKDYLEDEDIPLEERMERNDRVQANRYENSPAHKAKLEALKKLRGE